mgnify:FL=1
MTHTSSLSWFRTDPTAEERRAEESPLKLRWWEVMVGDMILFNRETKETVWCVVANKKGKITVFDVTNQRNILRNYTPTEYFRCTSVLRNGEVCQSTHDLRRAL